MDTVINNEYGKIKLSENLLGQIVRRAILSANGHAWLATPKGKLIDGSNLLVSLQTYAQSVEYQVIDHRLYVTIYVICQFGKSLNSIVGKIFKQLEKDIPNVISIDLAQIEIIVKGIKSKEIAKRDIKFVERYDD